MRSLLFILLLLLASLASVTEQWGIYETQFSGPSTGNPFNDVHTPTQNQHHRHWLLWTDRKDLHHPLTNNHGAIRVAHTYHFASPWHFHRPPHELYRCTSLCLSKHLVVPRQRIWSGQTQNWHRLGSFLPDCLQRQSLWPCCYFLFGKFVIGFLNIIFSTFRGTGRFFKTLYAEIVFHCLHITESIWRWLETIPCYIKRSTQHLSYTMEAITHHSAMLFCIALKIDIHSQQSCLILFVLSQWISSGQIVICYFYFQESKDK